MTFESRENSRNHLLRTQLFSADTVARMTKTGYLAAGDGQENLCPGIRQAAHDFFITRQIAGHGQGAWDVSLTSSQVACVNCFYPFIRQPEALTAIFRPILGDVAEVLPIEAETPFPDGSYPYLTFEWIDRQNRLGEPGTPQRGRNVTNVDVVLRYRTTAGNCKLVLVEWKYRESYSQKHKQISDHGTDRLTFYAPHFAGHHCQINLTDGLSVTDLMYDPFDQLMRLQLLASIYQRDSEMGASEVVVLLISPRSNHEFHSRVHSPALKVSHKTVSDAWRAVTQPGSFYTYATEDLVPILAANAPNVATRDYLVLRYGGMS